MDLNKGTDLNIQTLKLELVRKILETESQKLLDKIYAILKTEEPDFWDELTEDQKREISIARKQFEDGEVEEWEAVYQRLSNKKTPNPSPITARKKAGC